MSFLEAHFQCAKCTNFSSLIQTKSGQKETRIRQKGTGRSLLGLTNSSGNRAARKEIELVLFTTEHRFRTHVHLLYIMLKKVADLKKLLNLLMS